MLVVLITIVHVIVCFFLIIVVLLQSGKSADIAGAFGGMGSQTAFGPRGAATVLSKATTTSAIIFMLTSVTLVWLSSHRSTRSVLSGAPIKSQSQPAAVPVPATAPANPAPLQSQPQMDQPLNPNPPQQTPQTAPAQGSPAARGNATAAKPNPAPAGEAAPPKNKSPK